MANTVNNPRKRRIFGPDGRAVIIAMDHSGYFGPLPGFEEPGPVLDAVVAAGADAILTTAGIAAGYAERFGRAGLIIRADGGSTRRDPNPPGQRQTFSVDQALRIGADAVACMGLIGFREEAASLRVLTDLAAECSRWGLLLMAEMLVRTGEGVPTTAHDIAFAARIGADLGADWIKTSYVGPPEAYRVVTRSCYRPVVILGGEQEGDERRVLSSVAGALEAGAAGVAIGRNVWQHPNPAGMTRALLTLVHGGATVDEALAELRR